MNYLQLVNFVIREGGFEMTELTSATWSSAEAGRRFYPRVKRAVADAWTTLQMSRNEWEFKNKEVTTQILPRFLVDGVAITPPSLGPAPGVVYVGDQSGLVLTVINFMTGPDTGEYYLEFSSDGDYNRAMIGETFNEQSPNANLSSFVYRGRGAYRTSDIDPLMREPRWATFVGYQDNSTPIPVTYIPWENWLYKEISFTTATRSPPRFVSQDYKGDLIFYPQTLSPFYINFVYDTAPQVLVDYDDIPLETLLPSEYHDWIAWLALEQIARFDKNPDLLAYAQNQSGFYKARAERNLMPIPSWQGSVYNRRWSAW